MRQPRGTKLHAYAPKIWRHTPNITGDYEMDASIVHCKNPSVPSKLSMYVAGSDASYGPITNYNGYHGYKGDN